MAQERLHTLRNDPNLARFVVEGKATGKQLGSGSYGSVEEVELMISYKLQHKTSLTIK